MEEQYQTTGMAPPFSPGQYVSANYMIPTASASIPYQQVVFPETSYLGYPVASNAYQTAPTSEPHLNYAVASGDTISDHSHQPAIPTSHYGNSQPSFTSSSLEQADAASIPSPPQQINTQQGDWVLRPLQPGQAYSGNQSSVVSRPVHPGNLDTQDIYASEERNGKSFPTTHLVYQHTGRSLYRDSVSVPTVVHSNAIKSVANRCICRGLVRKPTEIEGMDICN
ncbi:hypothetical protein F4778DRAFT_761258 [Xylariomycetidae sp. FL2044]|nr:hypothetical protein F4778DRAFT_761258 [Xylariomycetidae sp. FL2044]